MRAGEPRPPRALLRPISSESGRFDAPPAGSKCAVNGPEHLQQRAYTENASIDRLIGEREQFRWRCEAERLGSPEIDSQHELCRVLDANSDGLAPLGIRSTYPAVRYRNTWRRSAKGAPSVFE